MRTGLDALTAREKETLRLLTSGHDAKSIARRLDLSIHTVNERLRDARRKLDVSSSREAARLLAEEEETNRPESLGDKEIGVPLSPAAMLVAGQAESRRGATHRLAWFSGGMLIMSLVIAAVVLTSIVQGGGAPAQSPAAPAAAPAPVADASASASLAAARTWIALVDGGRWDDSWNKASAMARAQVTAAQWTAMVQPVRQPLGAVKSRVFENVVKTRTLPGAPAADYEVIRFKTDFANRPGLTETAIMVREGAEWRMAGYFIK